MNLYLTLIGIISTISCILIIICINSKPSRSSSFPSDGSKSPLATDGLSQSQKSQLLLIVCVIFFMSLVTTNVKTSKFAVIFGNLMSTSEQTAQESAIDLRQIFYGGKRNCQFKINTKSYLNLFDQLKESQMDKKFIDRLIGKNFQEQFISEPSKQYSNNQSLKINPQLLIFNSNRRQLGASMVLPALSEKICKQTKEHVPIMYVNLEGPMQSEEKLMEMFRMDNYNTLKQSLCKLNGIEIHKEVQQVGNYLIERETYSTTYNPKPSRHHSYLVIDNFQHLDGVLILNKNFHLSEYSTDPIPNENMQNPQNPSHTLSLAPQYQLFIDKLFNDLISNCKVNVILHTSKHQEVTKFHSLWKKFYYNSQLTPLTKSSQLTSKSFPFIVKNWKGLTKIQFYQIVKEMIHQSSKLKDKEELIWRVFQDLFGDVPITSHKVVSNDRESSILIDHEQLLLTQLQEFFNKIAQLTKKQSGQKIGSVKKSLNAWEVKENVAQYYGLKETFKMIKNLPDSKDGVSLSFLKRKVSLNDLKELEKLKLLYIQQGRVYLVK